MLACRVEATRVLPMVTMELDNESFIKKIKIKKSK